MWFRIDLLDCGLWFTELMTDESGACQIKPETPTQLHVAGSLASADQLGRVTALSLCCVKSSGGKCFVVIQDALKSDRKIFPKGKCNFTWRGLIDWSEILCCAIYMELHGEACLVPDRNEVKEAHNKSWVVRTCMRRNVIYFVDGQWGHFLWRSMHWCFHPLFWIRKITQKIFSLPFSCSLHHELRSELDCILFLVQGRSRYPSCVSMSVLFFQVFLFSLRKLIYRGDDPQRSCL